MYVKGSGFKGLAVIVSETLKRVVIYSVYTTGGLVV